MICQIENATGELPSIPDNLIDKIDMILPACGRDGQLPFYVELMILRCTVYCRFRFGDCPLIRGSFFMFVESGCISTNIEFTVP